MNQRGIVPVPSMALRRWHLSTAVLLGLLCAAVLPLRAQDKKNSKDQGDAGLILSTHATAKEVGLPIYPGARPHNDEDENSQAVKMGLWGTSFGFKLVVLKLESDEAPDKIAAFYQKELARYGKVLNCTDAPSTSEEKGKSSKELTCDEKPEKGGQEFKAGTKEKQRVVGIQPNGKGTLFQLVYVEARGEHKPL
jgi:hypothetical protein